MSNIAILFIFRGRIGDGSRQSDGASQPVWQRPNLRRARLHRPRKKSAILSSRAQRGICFFTNTSKKADSSGKPRPRNDSFGVFPQPVQPRRSGTRKTMALAPGALPNLDGLLIMRWVPVSDGGAIEDFDFFNC